MRASDLRSYIVSVGLSQNWLNFTPEELVHLPISKNNKAVLVRLGLPKWVAPYIRFFEEFTAGEHEVAVGEDGAGNALVLFADSDIVLARSQPGGKEEFFVAGSLDEFLGSLATYAEFIVDSQKKYGDRVHLEHKVPAEAIDRLELCLKGIDANLISNGSFWGRVVAQLCSYRDS